MTISSLSPLNFKSSRLITLAVSCALGVSGCASIEGQQAPIDMTVKTDNSACPTTEAITAWETDKDMVVRSRLIDECVDAIDLMYAQFVRALRTESASVNLGADLIAQGLSTGAALSGGEEAKALSAISAGVAGIGATIDKDLYYKKTLPALVAAMNANRNVILTRIRKSERDDPGYTPSRARHDLREYAHAGSIDVAITKVTEEASADEAESMDKLQNVFQAGPIDAETAIKAEQFADHIRELVEAGDMTKLSAIAGVIGAPVSKEPRKQGNAIRFKLFQRLREKDAKAAEVMKELMAKLKEVLPNEKWGSSHD